MKKKIGNKFTMGGYLKLAEWWKLNYSTMSAEGYTYVQAAKKASKELGLPVGPSNVMKIAKELDKPLNSSHSKLGVKALRINDRVATLEMLVNYLYNKLGESIPATLVNEENNNA